MISISIKRKWKWGERNSLRKYFGNAGFFGVEFTDGSDNIHWLRCGRWHRSDLRQVAGGTFAFTIGQGFNADVQLQSHTYPDVSQQSAPTTKRT